MNKEEYIRAVNLRKKAEFTAKAIEEAADNKKQEAINKRKLKASQKYINEVAKRIESGFESHTICWKRNSLAEIWLVIDGLCEMFPFLYFDFKHEEETKVFLSNIDYYKIGWSLEKFVKEPDYHTGILGF